MKSLNYILSIRGGVEMDLICDGCVWDKKILSWNKNCVTVTTIFLEVIESAIFSMYHYVHTNTVTSMLIILQ